MLRWAKAAVNPAQVEAYFFERRRDGVADYYLIAEEQGIGYWGGEAAKRLGLEGQITQDDFRALIRNRDPQRPGESLTSRNKEGRRIGWDITFSPPKSLSLLWTVTKDQRILEAMRQAVDETMTKMEHHAAVRVRKSGADHDRSTGNAVWTTFTHYTARPTHDGAIPDPQLHCHAFLFNVSHDDAENQWKALQNGRMRIRAKYMQAVFHAKLSKAVKDLGYGVDRRGEARWEVAAVPRQLIERFSSRTKQIEVKAHELGLRDPRKLSELGAKTRAKKAANITLDQLHELWWEKFTPDELHDLTHADRFKSAKGVSPEQALDQAIAHCFERHSVNADYRIKDQALLYGMGSVTPEEIDQAFEALDWLSHTDADGVTLVTTQAVLEEERWLVRFARDGLGRHGPLGHPDRVIHPRKLEDGTTIELNADQQAACRHLWTCGDTIMAIRGKAGTGKTTLIQEAVKGIEARGKKVIALAPSAEASRVVLREAGLKHADTVEMFLINPAFRQRAKGQVILIDEASLVGVRTMVKVMREAQKLNARVILVGDVRQHKAVERGDVLSLLSKYAYIKPLTVSRILRQKGDYRKAVELLSDGRTREGFEKLNRMGCVIEIEDEQKRYAQLAKDYADAIEKGKSVLAVSPTHAEGHLVTAAIRAELKSRGLVDESVSKTLAHQKNLQWTDADRKDPTNYEPGMTVFFHKAVKGFKPRTWAKVKDVENNQVRVIKPGGGVESLPLHKAERFNVYQPQKLDLAKGDLVRFTQNTRVLAAGKYHRVNGPDIRRRRISNGTQCVVKGFAKSTGNPILKPTSGSNRQTFEVAADNGLFTHGYCSTSHASQGKTVDEVFIAQSAESHPASNQEQFYVSVSRGKERVRIYTDGTPDLARAVEQMAAQPLALDVAQQAGVDLRLERARELIRIKMVEKSREVQRKAYELARRTRDLGRRMDYLRRDRGMGYEYQR